MEKFPTGEEKLDATNGMPRRDLLRLGLRASVGALIGTEIGCEKEKLTSHIDHEGTSFDGSEAHKSGNDFANKVGSILQENLKNGSYSKVTHPSVKISIRNVGGKIEFKFIWHCDIENCEAKDADKHFDRRGTLLSGKTLDEAKQKVEAELRSSNKVNNMMQGFDRAYGKHKMPPSFVSEAYLQTPEGSWWYVKEFFCTAN